MAVISNVGGMYIKYVTTFNARTKQATAENWHSEVCLMETSLATMFRALKHIMLKEESLHDNIVAAESYYLCTH
jgi:hypothetical protein